MFLLSVSLNAITIPIVVFLIITTVILVLKVFKNNRALSEKVVYYALLFLLVYKTAHYLLYCTVLDHTWSKLVPVEISQVSYFLWPIAYLSGNKWIRDSGRFIALFAGLVQLVALAVSPQSFVATVDLTYVSLVESTFVHYILFATALISITCIEEIEVENLWQTQLGLFIVLMWGVLAAYTWRFDHVNGKPENIMFLHECVLPKELIALWPWLGRGHNFIIPYLIAYFGFTAMVYLISHYAFKNQKHQEKTVFGAVFIKSNYIKALK